MRWKMETYHRIRLAYTHCAKLTPAVTPDLIRSRLLEPQDDLCQFHIKAFEEMNLPEQVISEADWLKLMAQEEKHAVDSFTNLLYKQQNPEWRDPREDVGLKVQSALSDEALTLEAARAILVQAAEALKPRKDVDLYVPPAERNTWKRFRTAVSSFFDIVTDEMTTLQSKDELLMMLSELKVERDDLDRELEEMRNFKDRFEALEQDAGPEYAKIIAQKQKEIDKQKKLTKDIRADFSLQKKQVDVYEDFMNNKFDKY